ncbi:MAG: hypothetical protein PHW82_14010 [Bacteroidales bacterium]|nr:hypothetical protein [Bacteroidales bacterium]
MIIKYRLISAESDDFVRDIEIYSNNSFEDLHNAIQVSCDYDSSLMSSFYLSNTNWDKLQEIVQEIIDKEFQTEVMLMQDTKLSDLSPKKAQRYIYLFDFFSERAFFIEIVNIREQTPEDKKLEFPVCTLSQGKAPKQIFIDDEIPNDFEDEGSEEFFDNPEDFGFENIDDYDL